MQTKSFFILFFFLLVLALLVGGALSGQDLTPDTPPAPTTVSSFDQTVPITNTFSGIPGSCGSAFTVRSGDTLSSIARACGVSLDMLLAANPTITDPHLIRPGQVIAVPAANAVTVNTAPQPAVADERTVKQNLTQPTPKPSGLVPGGSVNVVLKAMPPESKVTIAIGKAGNIPMNVDRGTTDASGTLALTVAIPHTAKSGEKWQVTVITEQKPIREFTSPVFTIHD